MLESRFIGTKHLISLFVILERSEESGGGVVLHLTPFVPLSKRLIDITRVVICLERGNK
jgi:hypothetical protein